MGLGGSATHHAIAVADRAATHATRAIPTGVIDGTYTNIARSPTGLALLAAPAQTPGATRISTALAGRTICFCAWGKGILATNGRAGHHQQGDENAEDGETDGRHGETPGSGKGG